jgi:hypothetical protein
VTTFLDRFLRRPDPARKATTGGAWLSAYQQGYPNLSSLAGVDPQDRMRRYLSAYSVGWFHKAGRKISSDVGGLVPTLAFEDVEGDNEEDVVAPANNIPFDALTPTEQFLRLMERPNPGQTGRMLRQKTQIRLDFAGAAIWYLEGGDGGQLPTAIYGINPARMEPSYAKGGGIAGWVMDRGVNGSPGIPFTNDEIVLFTTACATDEWYGTSIVEAVWTQVPLTDMIARHTADVLTTGGRLAGMMWPKDRALDETEFQEAARAWRNVASDPNAARRLLLFPEPMEYAAGAATPKDIGIPELAQLSRDEITTAFPINPYVLGVPVEPGMSSGETLKYVSRDYWRNSVHDRAELLEETIQVALVPRYEQVVGRPLDFDLEEPDLDGAVEVIEKTGALRALITLGFEPKAAISKVGLDDIEWLGLPAALDPTAAPAEGAAATESGQRVAANDSNMADAGTTTVTLSKAAKATSREDVIGETLPGFEATMARFLAEQRDRLAANVEREFGGLTKAQRKAAPATWWDPELEDRLLTESLNELYVSLSRTALTVVANEVGRVVTKDRIRRVTEIMLESAGKRIKDINATTFEAARDTLAIGVERGYSLNQIIYGNPKEGFPGLRDLKHPETGKEMFDPYRAELVARTETMLAYNESALRGYREYDVTKVIASDGDKDEVCANRNGREFPVDEALGIEDHPNGTLDWVPVMPERGKSADESLYKAIEALATRPEPPAPVVNNYINLPETKVSVPEQPATVVNVAASEPVVVPAPVVNVTSEPVFIPAPVVNVTSPEVKVAPPNVNVEAPVVNVNVPKQAAPVVNVAAAEAPVVNVEAKASDVTVTMPDRLTVDIGSVPATETVRKVMRDAEGTIIGVVDVTV